VCAAVFFGTGVSDLSPHGQIRGGEGVFMNKKVFIHINPLWIGHIPAYAAIIWPRVLARGYHLINLTNDTESSLGFELDHFGGRNSEITHVRVFPNRHFPNHLERSKTYWDELSAAIREIESNCGCESIVFHQWADLYTDSYLPSCVVSRAIQRPWSAVCIHPVEFRVRKSIKRRLFEAIPNLISNGFWEPHRMRALRNNHLKSIYFPDENILSEAEKYFAPTLARAFPEISSTETAALPSEFAAAESRIGNMPLMGILGVMAKRKGYFEALMASMELRGKWFFVFAGKVDWSELSAEEKRMVRASMEEPAGNVFWIDRTLSDGELNAIAKKCDLVSVAYRDFFHSANLQVKAAQFRIPALAGPRHLSHERNLKFGLGPNLEGLDARNYVDFLKHADRTLLNQYSKTARYEDFLAEHDEGRFEDILDEMEALQLCGRSKQ
jgi:hypothetical protein